MFVCALVLTVGLAAVMGILYSNFDGQMRKELSKEAALSGIWCGAAGNRLSEECKG